MKRPDEGGSGARTWLSSDLADFAAACGLDAPPHARGGALDADVVIVGSGYGGAIALDELAGRERDGRPLRIVLLERGREYTPGAFPSRSCDLGGHFRLNLRGQRRVLGQPEGLFDLRVGPDVCVVQGNGLGGGSLINAGVLARPTDEVLADARWPLEIRRDTALAQRYEETKKRLGAQPAPRVAERVAAMDALAPAGASGGVDVSVAREDDPALGVRACNHCGDCATGCNFRAKLSVDVSLLAQAAARHDEQRLHIVTGATVVGLRREAVQGWRVQIAHTARALREAQHTPYTLRTHFLILAAGALGSTELLLRARADGLPLSPLVGQRFSANGDNLAAVYDTQRPTRAISTEELAFAQRGVGPTITRMVDLRRDPQADVIIQDLAIPGPLRRVFEEIAAGGCSVARLLQADGRAYADGADGPDEAGIDRAAIDRSFVVAVIGRDAGAGRLALPRGAAEEGTLGVHWRSLHRDRMIENGQRVLERLAARGHPRARVLANPLRQPLPHALERLYGRSRGPAISVHPLGGCVMGDSGAAGAVNAIGQVYRGSGAQVYEDLVVLDGAVVPLALGINPSLTIAVLAARAMQQLRRAWRIDDALARQRSLPPRPAYRVPPLAQAPLRTEFELTEQMCARLDLATEQGWRPYDVALELWFEAVRADQIVLREAPRTLRVDAARSRLRVYPADAGDAEARRGRTRVAPLLEAPLAGELQLLRHAASQPLARALAALWAGWRNRGLRDIFRALGTRTLARNRTGVARSPGDLLTFWAMATRAGAERRLVYDLRIGECETPPQLRGRDGRVHWAGGGVRAIKRLRYIRACNAIEQLTQADLVQFPLRPPGAAAASLQVDLPYFARVGVPLLRVRDQSSAPGAWADTAAVLGYFGRALMPLYAWNLRTPDRREDRRVQRLPRGLPGLPPPQVTWLPVDEHPDGRPIHIRLARYRAQRAPRAGPAVLLTHGYSASGTTFAHQALPEGGLAGHLARRGFDVWVADLRSSAGLATRGLPWSFEQVGCEDIACAVEHIVQTTCQAQVDVVAHCMSAAMLSLALFGDGPAGSVYERKGAQRRALRQRIGRLVLSQVGPALIMAPANTARAWFMQWMRHAVGVGRFAFAPRGKPSAWDDMLDRVLAFVPYPAPEIKRENPLWPPWRKTAWAGTRHRMDLLYGVTFQLATMDDAVLERIDDFFGPLNLQTVEQVIAFARDHVVTDRRGYGGFMVPERVGERLRGPVLHLHSSNNGLVDFRTGDVLGDLLDAAGVPATRVDLRGMGHQDSLIGTRAPEVYGIIAEFLERRPAP